LRTLTDDLVQDAAEDDDDEEEEEEEEETARTTSMKGQKIGKQIVSDPLFSLARTPGLVRSARTSPTTSGGTRSPDDKPLIDLSVYTLPSFGQSFGEGKVRTVRQWAPRTDWVGTAQV